MTTQDGENVGARTLRRRLAGNGYVFAPNIWSPLQAKLADLAGVENIHVGGGGVGNGIVGEIEGTVDRSEMAQAVYRVCQATDHPTTCDVQTGWGDAMNVRRTIREFENAGVAGVQIEDQELFGKRSGHIAGKRVVDREAAVRRVRAAVAGKQCEDTIVIARTDAKGAVNVDEAAGTDEAVERGRRFLDAGADVLYPEFVTTGSAFPIEFAERVHETHPDAVFKANYSPSLDWSGADDPITAEELGELGYTYITLSTRSGIYAWYHWFETAVEESPREAVFHDQQLRADHPKLADPLDIVYNLSGYETLEELEEPDASERR